MNLAISESSNRSTLLNIARASMAEPLSFSSLGSFTGHNTITSNSGAPAIGLTGNQLRVQTVTVSGPTFGGTISNDFTYTSNNDTATLEALLQPIKPAVAGYFLRQEYKRDVLFFLLIAQMKITYSNGRVKTLEFDPDNIANAPLANINESDPIVFGNALQEMLQAGLTAELDDITNRKAKICFDASIPKLYPNDEVGDVSFSPRCSVAPILPTIDPDPKKSDKDLPFRSGYLVHDNTNNRTIELKFRSTFGIYKFLGSLVRNNIELQIVAKDTREPRNLLVNISAKGGNCFVEQLYRGERYCVPSDAYTTKRIFALVNDLVKLYTVPQIQAQPTLTARLIGQ